MASSLMHICLAKKVNEKLKLNPKQVYLGSIAPDINHWTKVSKLNTHFSNQNNPDIPNIDIFLKQYHSNFNNPFILGYFTHLYADKMWYEKFMPDKCINNKVKLLDGTLKEASEYEWPLMYEDFYKLTSSLIEYFKLDLSFCSEDFSQLENIIKDFPYDKLPILTNEVSLLPLNKTKEKTRLFNLEEILNFIDNCTNDILQILKTQDIIS